MKYEEPIKLTEFVYHKNKPVVEIRFKKGQEPKLFDRKGREIELSLLDENSFLKELFGLIAYYMKKRVLRRLTEVI